MASSSRLICHGVGDYPRSEEHTSELQSLRHLVCRLLLGKKKHTSELQSLRHLVCRLLLEKKKESFEREHATQIIGLLVGCEKDVAYTLVCVMMTVLEFD